MYPSTSSSEDAIQMLRGIAKKTKSKLAQGLTKDREFETACSVACQLFYEAMDEFKDGSMTWKEAIDDLYENLKAVPMPPPSKENGDSEDGE